MVANREDLYKVLEGRKVLALGGHTHTLEHFLPGEEEEGWGQPTPIPQTIVGAACGSWWSGIPDEYGIPMSYQRDAAPKGYMNFTFTGNRYYEQYKASGKPHKKQMNISFLMPQSTNSIKEGIITSNDLQKVKVVANVWNATERSEIMFQIDNQYPTKGIKDNNIVDPYVSSLQASLDEWLRTKSSTHIWTAPLPYNLEPGLHQVTVITRDIYGFVYKETKMFEVWKTDTFMDSPEAFMLSNNEINDLGEMPLTKEKRAIDNAYANPKALR
jgi:hypothetical protein